MKKLMTLFAAPTALLLAVPVEAAPVGAIPKARGQALILLPLTLSRIDDLSFGTVISSPVAGTVTIPTDGSARVSGGGVTLVASDPGLRARFAGAGSANQQVIVTVTNPGTLTDIVTGNTVTVQSLNLSTNGLLSDTLTIDATQAFSFYVGGTIDIAANQPEGLYESEFDVVADYQ